MGLTRVGGMPWFVAAALAAGALAASGLEAQGQNPADIQAAQEVEPSVDSTEVWERPPIVSLGLRMEFAGLASPGASVQVTVIPGRLWLSLEYLAQMVRWKVQYDPHTRRDHHHFGRLVAGVGRGDGPILFVFHERGVATIKTHPKSWRGRTYYLSGIGLGAGYTVRRVTGTLELSVGGANRSSGSLYASLGASLRFRLF